MAKELGAVATSIKLSDQQRKELASALQIDVKFVPEDLGIVGVPRQGGAKPGIPIDRAGQFSPALIVM